MKTIDLLQIVTYTGENKTWPIAVSDNWTAESIKKAILDHAAHNHNLTNDRLDKIATRLLNGGEGFDGDCTYYQFEAIPKMD